jgi:hypothetical protein
VYNQSIKLSSKSKSIFFLASQSNTKTVPPIMTTMHTPSDDTQDTECRSRAALRMARRVVIKAGTSVVANEDGL